MKLFEGKTFSFIFNIDLIDLMSTFSSSNWETFETNKSQQEKSCSLGVLIWDDYWALFWESSSFTDIWIECYNFLNVNLKILVFKLIFLDNHWEGNLKKLK
jgi:hypothetical protein